MTDTDTIFKGRSYSIVQKLPVTPALANDGMVEQCVIKSAKGHHRLLQMFADGTRRTITTASKVEYEYPTAA